MGIMNGQFIHMNRSTLIARCRLLERGVPLVGSVFVSFKTLLTLHTNIETGTSDENLVTKPPLRAPPNVPSILDCSYVYDIQKGYNYFSILIQNMKLEEYKTEKQFKCNTRASHYNWPMDKSHFIMDRHTVSSDPLKIWWPK
jgi:hypothetical protein